MEPKELQSMFDGAKTEIVIAVQEAQKAFRLEIEERDKKGHADPETKERVDRAIKRLDDIDARLGAPGAGNTHADFKSVGARFTEDERFLKWQKSGCRPSEKMTAEIVGGLFEQKTPIGIGNIGAGSSGVQMPTRLPGIIDIQKQELRIRDLIPTRTLTMGNSIDYLKQNAFTNAASPQVEAQAKAESTITYTTATAAVRTLAHFVQVTRQALDDVAWLRSDIDDMLMYGLKLVEEREILTGSGSGEHLNGIVTQATAYDSGTYAVSGDTKLDTLRSMILQARLALYPVDGIVLNPRDLAMIEKIKTEEGGANKGVYVVGDPKTGTQQKLLWGKPVVESDSIPYQHALVGAFGLGAIIFDRMQAVIDISFEHSTNFTTNQATVLAEERLALAVVRPASFIYGTI